MKPFLAALFSVEGLTLKDDEKRIFEEYNPLGVVLFNRNLKTKEQAKHLVDEIKTILQRDDVLIAVDQEGGRVNRLRALGFKEYASEDLLGRINDAKTIKQHADLIARDMHSIGANLNFAPVLDLTTPMMTNALVGRTFSDAPEKTAEFGRMMWKEYKKCGICPCMKHLPGHGFATCDPHLMLPKIELPFEALEDSFLPFEKNRDCPSGMTAHIVLECVDDKNPITLSEKAIREIIRGKIGFEGFLFSDAIEMFALKGTIKERAERALDAGCDCVCYCLGKIEDMRQICSLKRCLTDEALVRFEKIKKIVCAHKTYSALETQEKKYYNTLSQYEEIKVNYDATETLCLLSKGEK